MVTVAVRLSPALTPTISLSKPSTRPSGKLSIGLIWIERFPLRQSPRPHRAEVMLATTKSSASAGPSRRTRSPWSDSTSCSWWSISLLGEFSLQPFELQTLPFRHVKLRTYLQIELELHRSLSGISIASKSKSGSLIAEKSWSSLICVIASISSDPLTWSATCSRKRCSTSLRGARPGRKPGTLAVRHQLRERFLEITVHVLPRNRHGHVTLACPRLIDLDIQRQLGFLLRLLTLVVDLPFRANS